MPRARPAVVGDAPPVVGQTLRTCGEVGVTHVPVGHLDEAVFATFDPFILL